MKNVLMEYHTKRRLIDWLVKGVAVIALGIVVASCFLDDTSQVFQVVLNLSYSYLAGFIFYILTVYLPLATQESRALNIFADLISQISFDVEKAVKTLAAYGNIHQNLNEINEESCADMVLVSEQTRSFSTLITIIRRSEKTTVSEKMVFENTLSLLAKSIKTKINYVFCTPACRYLSEELQSLLTEIANSKLLEDLESMNNIQYPPYQVWFRHIRLAENYIAFIPLYQKILKFNSKGFRCDVRRLTPEEEASINNVNRADITPGERLNGIPVIWVGSGPPPARRRDNG